MEKCFLDKLANKFRNSGFTVLSNQLDGCCLIILRLQTMFLPRVGISAPEYKSLVIKVLRMVKEPPALNLTLDHLLRGHLPFSSKQVTAPLRSLLSQCVLLLVGR